MLRLQVSALWDGPKGPLSKGNQSCLANLKHARPWTAQPCCLMLCNPWHPDVYASKAACGCRVEVLPCQPQGTRAHTVSLSPAQLNCSRQQHPAQHRGTSLTAPCIAPQASKQLQVPDFAHSARPVASILSPRCLPALGCQPCPSAALSPPSQPPPYALSAPAGDWCWSTGAAVASAWVGAVSARQHLLWLPIPHLAAGRAAAQRQRWPAGQAEEAEDSSLCTLTSSLVCSFSMQRRPAGLLPRHRQHTTVSQRICEAGHQRTDWARKQGRHGRTRCRDTRAMLGAPPLESWRSSEARKASGSQRLDRHC